ncbi:hypothetical protein YB2330_000889 [Saitoella coloradoensis]
MVYYFSSNTTTPASYIYMGKHKEENEDLIKYGWENDVWFHVDNLSSAHVYVRLPEDVSWEQIPEGLLQDCAQLTKANSIEGNKKDSITIIYTPWSNLKKDGGMATGQVGFHKNKMVKRVHVATRENPIVNRLNKTKVERFSNLALEKQERLQELARRKKAAERERQKAEDGQAAEWKKLSEQKKVGYSDLWNDDNIRHSNNQDRDEGDEDDFW